MPLSDLHVIVGLGITGFSCARYLRECGIPFAVNDTRETPPQLAEFRKLFPDVQISTGKLDEALLARAATIVLSPGIALYEPLIAKQAARGIPVIGDIELFARAVKAPVIAITGTNAKSTVTTLVGMMAAAAGYDVQTGGNLGIPALDLLLNHPQANLFVLELSSFQLETTDSLKARVATVLNITPDHMDRYKTLADYAQAKNRIYKNCHIAVCNRDDPLTECHESSAVKKIYFTLNAPATGEFGLLRRNNTVYLAHGENALLAVSELPVAGKHYQANALAALAIGHGAGFSFASMLDVLREFRGLPHRCQLVRERNSVKWYNDSKGTNVGATQAAIEGLGSEISGKLILIMGGVGKNADFSQLAPVLGKYARHVVLIGEAAKDIAGALGTEVPFSFASDMNDAIEQAANYAHPSDSVLLSPACASFDMFRNYEHRGDVFTDSVEKLTD